MIVNLALGGCRNYMPLTFGGLKLYDIILGVVGACTRVRPRHKRHYHVRLLIGNMTYDSTPRAHTSVRPYELVLIVYYTFKNGCRGEPMCSPSAPTFISRPIVDRKHNVLFSAQGQPQALSLRINLNVNNTFQHGCRGAPACAPSAQTSLSCPIVDRKHNV